MEYDPKLKIFLLFYAIMLFVINNNGTATRKCFCCNEVINYEKIGEDIPEGKSHYLIMFKKE